MGGDSDQLTPSLYHQQPTTQEVGTAFELVTLRTFLLRVDHHHRHHRNHHRHQTCHPASKMVRMSSHSKRKGIQSGNQFVSIAIPTHFYHYWQTAFIVPSLSEEALMRRWESEDIVGPHTERSLSATMTASQNSSCSEVKFVHPVSPGGSVKFLPAV